MAMNKNQTFQCELCKEIFENGWSDAEALAEFKQNFPKEWKEPTAVVCDDCYEILREDQMK